jgi:flagellar biosynthesis/type III secretory pathway chaperone
MTESKETLKQDLSRYFAELDSVQTQIRGLLDLQQVCLAAPDAEELQNLARQQALEIDRLQSLIQRRADLLSRAHSLGISAANLRELASRLDDSESGFANTPQLLKLKLEALRQAGLSQWVACQKSFLHHGKLIQLIANGGRKPLMSSTGKPYIQGGAILDASV